MCVGSKGSGRGSANQAPEGGTGEPTSRAPCSAWHWILLSVREGPTLMLKHFRLGEGPRSLPAPSPLRGATHAPQWVTKGLVSR